MHHLYLMSTVDPQIAAEVADTLRRHGVQVHTGTSVISVERDGQDLMVHAGSHDGGHGRSWRARRLRWSSPESARHRTGRLG
jgi:NADH dehydrogenase FAD-containing subunit